MPIEHLDSVKGAAGPVQPPARRRPRLRANALGHAQCADPRI